MVVVSYIWYVIKYRQQDNVLYQGLKMPGSITEEGYYEDPVFIALEIFADLSSIEVLGGTKDPLIDVLFSEFIRITQ